MASHLHKTRGSDSSQDFGMDQCCALRNYIRQKAGEIETYTALEIGSQKWCKEHIPRNGHDLTEEGQILLEDPELWLDRPDWLLTKGENRDKLGE